MANHRITLTINGETEQADVPSNMTLLQMLREKLAFTGTKNGCNAGECGACTVLLDGEMLNKPADAAQAWAMLRKLRGRTHEVQSCLVVRHAGQEFMEIVSSLVTMRGYSDEEIGASRLHP